MNTIKTGLLVLIFGGLLTSVTSCKKIQQDIFIKGLWRINGLYFAPLTDNQMATHFPGFLYGNSCCTYKMDFQADDIVFGYYIKDDSFKSVVIGTWKITKYNQLQLQIDSFADGIFDIHKVTVKSYNLTSDHNHIKYYDGVDPAMDTTSTRIEIERI